MDRSHVEELLAATSVQELTSFLTRLSKSGAKLKWLPVGNKDNNLATINLGSDAAAGLVERITNAVDAVLDRRWHENGKPMHLRSPRAAVEEWYGIQQGRLAGIHREDLKQIEEVSRDVIVTLKDSNVHDSPTVDIRDRGVGLLPDEFGDSILSLNNSRKLKKLFLSGAFGQGGSTALAYSPYTLIFSRKAALGTEPAGPLGLTVVRYNAGNPDVDKHGLYEYLVDGATRKPFFVACEDDDWFEPGTLVRHVHMRLQKYSAVMTSPTGSLWWLAHNYLFDPVLPFRISETRKRVKEETSRMVTGNARRLSQGDNIEYSNSAQLHFRDGRVDIRWWVLSADDEGARERIRNYVMVSKPIIVTFNGQKQGDFPNTVLKDEVRVPFLDRYLVVQVDCDRLDAESRRELFPTTRETIRDSQIGDDLRTLIVETLSGDEKLRELDHKRKQRYMKSPSAPDEAIRKRLARRIRSTLLTGAGKGSPRVAPPEGSARGDDAPVIPPVEPPTFLTITSASPRKVYPGRTFTIKFDTDARADYFSSLDHFIAVVDPPGFGTFQGLASVRDGHGAAYFRAADGVSVGDLGEVTLEVRPSKSPSLKASVAVQAVALPETSGNDAGKAKTANINIIRVTKDEAFFEERGWDAKSVALVETDDESTNVFVSMSNEKLEKLVARAQRHNEGAVQSIRDFYVEHVSYFAVIDHLVPKSDVVADESTEELAQRVRPDATLINACDTICGIIESVFEVLVLDAAELSS